MDGQVVVQVERRPGLAVITLNRPAKLNALNSEVLDALEDALTGLERDPDVRAVVVTGAGDRAFCAGADLGELRGLDAARAREVLARGQRVMARVAGSPVPVIAAVNGYALGGGFELALASTFVLASTTASFALPETGLGLIPGYGGTQRLGGLVGRQAAAYLVTTGNRVPAERAHRWGLLAEEPLAPEALLPRAVELAGQIAGRGSLATRLALGLLAAAGGDLARGLQHETDAAALATVSGEARTRVAAFLDRPATRAGAER
ncbi:enoyl-CoA hydratase/isomerase family protein [Blastococcus sp. SYSU D00669]